MRFDYKNVLVTGTAGFIGFHLSRRLLENGCRVVGLVIMVLPMRQCIVPAIPGLIP